MDEIRDDDVFCLTPYAILHLVCNQYNIDISHLTSKMGEHFYEDLMKCLEANGYVERKES